MQLIQGCCGENKVFLSLADKLRNDKQQKYKSEWELLTMTSKGRESFSGSVVTKSNLQWISNCWPDPILSRVRPEWIRKRGDYVRACFSVHLSAVLSVGGGEHPLPFECLLVFHLKASRIPTRRIIVISTMSCVASLKSLCSKSTWLPLHSGEVETLSPKGLDILQW